MMKPVGTLIAALALGGALAWQGSFAARSGASPDAGRSGQPAASAFTPERPVKMAMVVVWDDGEVVHGEVPIDRCALVAGIAAQGKLNEAGDGSGRVALAVTCAPLLTVRAAFERSEQQ